MRGRARDAVGVPRQNSPLKLYYARLLVQAGVPTEIHHYSGAFHLAHVEWSTGKDFAHYVPHLAGGLSFRPEEDPGRHW